MGHHQTFFKTARETPGEKFRRKLAAEIQRRRKSREGARRPVARYLASSEPGLAIAKGPTQQSLKDAEDRAEAAHIRKVRAEVFAASSRCAFCGDTQEQSRAFPSRHQLHEDPPRSATRGLPNDQRWSRVVSCRICSWCHQRATENILVPVFADPAHGWLGDYLIRHRDWRIVASKTEDGLALLYPVETW